MTEIDWREVTEERELRIRTRGPVQTRPFPTAIRTRGGIGTGEAAPAGERPLEELVADLRERANGSPIAVVIHGWKEGPAQMFLKAIFPLLDEDDAIWLVPPNGAGLAEVPSELPGAIVLDFSLDTDKRIYNNLVVDIVFFSDGEPEDVSEWYRRVEAVIINSSASRSSELIEEASQNEQDVYCWYDSEPDKIERV